MGRAEGTAALLAARGGEERAVRALRQLAEREVLSIVDGVGDAGTEASPPSFAALVQQAYDALVDDRQVTTADRLRFKAITAEVAEAAVAELLRKAREARARPVGLPTLGGGPTTLTPEQTDQLLALDHALQGLATLDPRLRSLTVWHYYGGLSEEELASFLDVSEAAVRRDLIKARGLIYRGFRAPS